MDNITHTIVGLAAGDLIHRSLPLEPESEADSNRLRRRLFVSACALASNFPDLDLFLTPLLKSPLGYLLHHRGHTHTILYVIPQVLVLIALIMLAWPAARTLLKRSRAARIGFGASVLLGFALHLSMDFLNSYGIHPLYPFDSRWFFGDTVFIIEPIFWMACGIPLAMGFERRLSRAISVLVLIAAPIAFTLKGYLSIFSLAILISIAAFQVWWSSWERSDGSRGRRGLVAGFLFSLVFIFLQCFASIAARTRVAEVLQARHRGSTLLDAAMTPMPTNPFCWSFSAIESSEADGTFIVTNGRMSLVPDLIVVEKCPVVMADETAESSEMARGILILHEETGNLDELRHLAKENCDVDAWLRFARIPILNDTEVWDARFVSRAARGNFTRLELDETSRTCAGYIPGWGRPREDMLHRGGL